jgi:hypothetical protein
MEIDMIILKSFIVMLAPMLLFVVKFMTTHLDRPLIIIFMGRDVFGVDWKNKLETEL